MSEYPAHDIETCISGPSSVEGLRPRAMSVLRSARLPATGAILALLGYWAMTALPGTTPLRYGAAFAATSAWLYVAASPRLSLPMILANLLAVASMITLAILSMRFSAALPAVFAVHAGWSLLLADRLPFAPAWIVLHLVLALMLWIA